VQETSPARLAVICCAASLLPACAGLSIRKLHVSKQYASGRSLPRAAGIPVMASAAYGKSRRHRKNKRLRRERGRFRHQASVEDGSVPFMPVCCPLSSEGSFVMVGCMQFKRQLEPTSANLKQAHT
jgi:hypothetical protein